MIRIASSLTNRIFIASTLLAIVSLGLAFYFVNARVSSEAEADLQRSLTEAATLVDLRRQNLTETFRTMARLVADIPKLKATMSTPSDAKTAEELVMAKSTVQRLADEYRELISADLFVLSDPRGAVLGLSGDDAEPIPRLGDPSKPLEEIATLRAPRARSPRSDQRSGRHARRRPAACLRTPQRRVLHGRPARRPLQGVDRHRDRVRLAGQDPRLVPASRDRDTLVGVLHAQSITSLTLGGEEYSCSPDRCNTTDRAQVRTRPTPR